MPTGEERRGRFLVSEILYVNAVVADRGEDPALSLHAS
jgi:hypothetical protein